jgi:hypothetical protein
MARWMIGLELSTPSQGGMEAMKSIALAIAGLMASRRRLPPRTSRGDRRANAGMVEAFKAGDAAAIARFYLRPPDAAPDATEVAGRRGRSEALAGGSTTASGPDAGSTGVEAAAISYGSAISPGAGREQHHDTAPAII